MEAPFYSKISSQFNCLKLPTTHPQAWLPQPEISTRWHSFATSCIPKCCQRCRQRCRPFRPRHKTGGGGGTPERFLLTPLPSRAVAISLVPKVCNLALSEVKLILWGPQASVGGADFPLGAPVLLSPQIHSRSPVSQGLGFTQTPSVQNSALKESS